MSFKSLLKFSFSEFSFMYWVDAIGLLALVSFIYTSSVCREAIGLFGLLVASVTPTVLYYYFKDDNFHILAVILMK